jgi:hypothetical protein
MVREGIWLPRGRGLFGVTRGCVIRTEDKRDTKIVRQGMYISNYPGLSMNGEWVTVSAMEYGA